MRNLVAVGNPIPYTTFGPLGLPAPERAFELRPGFSVFHYCDRPRGLVATGSPGPRRVVRVPLAAGDRRLRRRRGLRALARRRPAAAGARRVVLFTALAYVVHPADRGRRGGPADRVRVERPLHGARGRGRPGAAPVPAGRRGAPSARARSRFAGLALLFADHAASLVQWQQGHVKGAIAAGVAVLAAFAAIEWLRARGRWGPRAPVAWVAGLLAVVALGALGAGWWEQRHYLERRYENLSPELKLADAVRWARDLRDAKIARRRRPRRLQPVPVLRHRPLQPGPVARAQGPRRRLRADPDLRRVAPGARRRRLHARGHHLRPVRPRARSPTPRRRCGRARTRAPSSSSATGR